MEFSFLRSLKAYLVLLLTGALLFTTGCEDDDHDHDHDEDHADVDGFILEHDGEEVYRQFDGVETGSVTVAVDSALELSVHFLDHDEEEIEHEEEEGEEHEDGLVVSVADASIAHVEVEEHEEEGDDDGDDDHDHDHDEHGMAIHVEGVSAGSTTFTLSLMHDGHSDYTSLPVTVTVQ
ncbi:MAG: hypothetical protein CMG55_04675 [Candidatus Marinimicrobia bacterium]|mgnify:CR=1 FL=1|nr:hypothetical protein [Candidatus Neomarinimicrobiota bacterium]